MIIIMKKSDYNNKKKKGDINKNNNFCYGILLCQW